MDLTSLKFLPSFKDLLSSPVAFFSAIIFVTAFTWFYFYLVHLVWHYWMLLRAFRKFPSYHIDVNWIFRIIFGFYPRDVPFSNVVFQVILKACKRNEREGICLMRFFYPFLVIFNEDFCKKFFSEPAIADKSVVYSLITDILGNGLLTSNANVWKNHRKLLNPVFHLSVLKGKMGIFNENAAELVQKLQDLSGKPTVKVIDFLKSQNFKILAESILGLKLNDEKYGSKVMNYVEAFERECEVLMYRLPRPWLFWRVTLPLFSEGRKYMKLSDDILNFTQEILLEMKNSIVTSRAFEEEPVFNSESKKSFTRILIEEHLKDPTFTLKDVQDHVTTIMAAGHDTASYTLMWCLYLLGQHPEVQEKTFMETQNIKGWDVTYEDLCELKYLECVIKETLRLYSIVPLYGRKLSKEIQCGVYTIPKGTDIYFFLYLMHRNPNIYEDPDAFKPERFLENSNIRPWMFMPFAEGFRSCIGKKFAMMQMKVLLVHILRRFEIKTLDKVEEKDLDWVVVLRPVKPVRMLFTVRQSRSLAQEEG